MSEKIYFNAEGFNLKTEKLEDGSQSVILEGVAMPLNKMSRNKVFYRPESVKKAYSTMKGAAFLFNHNTDISLGHVEDVGLDEKAEVMTYRANMDPSEEKFVNKVKRQDIRHVSVGCLVSNVDWDEESMTATCDIDEFVELSLVPVPGFKDATANINGEFLEATPLLLAEKLGNKEMIEKMKAAAEKKKEADDEDDSDKSDEEESDDEDPEDEGCKKKKKGSQKLEKKEGDDEDKDKSDEEDDSEDDSEEADDEDPEDKEKKNSIEKKEADDEDDSDDSDDSDEAEDDDEDKDKEESAKAKSEEDLKKEAEGEEESVEEKLSTAISRIEELFAKVDEMTNRLSILEANMDALNDSEEDAEGKADNEEGDEGKVDESLNPDTSEKFVDKKIKEKQGMKIQENLAAKEKALLGEESKKLKEGKKVVDMRDVRMSNISY